MAKIEFRDLTKIFPGGTVAVDALDLEVADGEFLVLVGPSGSGKTTVLRITAGLEEATRGEILIGGAPVNDIAPMDRNIAMVFQNYALYPHMTVYENMAFGLKLHGMKKAQIKPRVESAAQMLGIGELLKRKPSQLSGGQRQRVAMGRAIVREPAAFLMDEPLSNLDAKLRVEMRAYVAMLHQQLKTTTLYVTHDQTEAMTMGTRVAVMRTGRVEQCDEPQNLYDRPANMFVAAFIGSPSMNLVRSQLSGKSGDLSVQFGGSSLRLSRGLLEAKPTLRQYVGRDVILGIRPEDIHDASLSSANGNAGLDVQISLAEPMGAEVVAHFPVKGEAVLKADDSSITAVLDAKEADSEASYLSHVGAQAAEDEVTVTARLNPRTKARAGEPLKVAIDVDRLHFFDPETNVAIV